MDIISHILNLFQSCESIRDKNRPHVLQLMSDVFDKRPDKIKYSTGTPLISDSRPSSTVDKQALSPVMDIEGDDKNNCLKTYDKL